MLHLDARLHLFTLRSTLMCNSFGITAVDSLAINVSNKIEYSMFTENVNSSGLGICDDQCYLSRINTGSQGIALARDWLRSINKT